jgi:predicted dehydrogenase
MARAMLPTRRRVLAAAAVATAATAGSRILRAAETNAPPLKAAIIGHTGRGDYGHGLDACFTELPGVQVVALADPDDAGRAKAAARARAPRQYADYRQMLTMENADIVVVAPRWSEDHREMSLAAIGAGAHVYLEKPIAPTLAEADDICAAAERAGRRIAVAHQMRLAPSVVHLKRKIDDGLIGDLLEMRAFGKQDARAGGEDMLVLGVHLFDLMRLFAGGDALWCTARVTQHGRDITAADGHNVKEQIGPVAGDEIVAQFAFSGGVSASFNSRARMRDQSGHWGVELIGSKASARLLADIWPTVFARPVTAWGATGRDEAWTPFPDDPGRVPEVDTSTQAANRRLVEDLIASIREKREPACSGANATKALEMVMAVYQAAIGGIRVEFPLTDRTHPLRKA